MGSGRHHGYGHNGPDDLATAVGADLRVLGVRHLSAELPEDRMLEEPILSSGDPEGGGGLLPVADLEPRLAQRLAIRQQSGDFVEFLVPVQGRGNRQPVRATAMSDRHEARGRVCHSLSGRARQQHNEHLSYQAATWGPLRSVNPTLII